METMQLTVASPVINKGDMQSLIDAFPCLKRKGMKWSRPDGTSGGSIFFESQIKGLSSGERDAALFVLSVWNFLIIRPKHLRFDAVKAVLNWGEGERAAFATWLLNPWNA